MTVEATTPEETLVLEFFEHWEKRDIDAIVSYFEPDGAYIDMPLPPRRGQDAIRAYLTEIFGAFTVKVETLAIASRGAVVMTERIDYLIRENQPTVDLPVMGVMEIRDGKIAEWRDYLDLKTVESGLAVSYEATGHATETVSIRSA
jgi:limonene-1,2-epoxide hydrolase